ncbi:MAG: YybS family protein [Desulfarculaceae bacterium]|nr:YybS family protein [Desulfarculaceae bacterium]MCF8065600.1 YybS family protein [Desulfarculaceae bacterium]MCF8124052.1 YybS family protein [Desulfarculaceae bacterium]
MSRALPGEWLPAAAAAAGAVVLFTVPWMLPLAGSVITFASPLPLLLAYGARGKGTGRRSLILAAAAALLLSQVAGPPGGSYYLIYFLVMAGTLGEMWSLGLPEHWAVGTAAGTAMAASVLVLLVGSIVYEIGPWQLWKAQWQSEMTMVMEMYRSMDLEPETLRQLEQGLAMAGRIILRMAPGILAAVSLVVAWLNFLAARRISRRLGAGEIGVPMNLYRTPERLVWLLILGGGVMALGSGWLFWLGANVVLVMGVLYFFQGLAVVDFWLRRKNAPSLLRAALYLMVALEIYVAAILAVTGLFDMWLNLRRLGQAKPSGSEE